jgi:hypothetical protein
MHGQAGVPVPVSFKGASQTFGASSGRGERRVQGEARSGGFMIRARRIQGTGISIGRFRAGFQLQVHGRAPVLLATSTVSVQSACARAVGCVRGD